MIKPSYFKKVIGRNEIIEVYDKGKACLTTKIGAWQAILRVTLNRRNKGAVDLWTGPPYYVQD